MRLKKKLATMILIASSTLLFNSCLKTRVHLKEQVGVPTYERSHNFFLWGLTPDKIVLQSDELCGRKRSATYLESKTTFVDGLLAVVTLGIFSPKTLIAHCSSRPGA